MRFKRASPRFGSTFGSSLGVFVMPNVTPENHKRIGDFLLHYGDFHAYWSTFDIMVEIMIMRKLGVDEQKNCIVCAGLGFGSKIYILCSLLNQYDGASAIVSMIKDVQSAAGRNGFAHGFFMLNPSIGEFQLVRRNVQHKYTANVSTFDDKKMQRHLKSFIAKVDELRAIMSISDRDIEDYVKHIEAYALAQASQDKPHPSPPTSSKKAKRK